MRHIYPIHWFNVSSGSSLSSSRRREMTETKQNPARVKLGRQGPEVFPMALGCMGMSPIYGQTDDAESIATVHAALERGVNLLDTGDFYGMGHNELLLGRALAGKRDQAILSVKFGGLRLPGGGW